VNLETLVANYRPSTVVASVNDVRESAFAYLISAVRAAAKEAISGPEKKAAVLAGLDIVVDRLFDALPWPAYLFLLKPFVLSLVKNELRRVAETAIEAILADQRGIQ
jgi:hypothetical protein